MDAKVGDRILIESEKVGKAAREGDILEVIESAETGLRLRVRWEDGHESTFWPHAGSARIVPTEMAKKSKKSKAPKA